MHNFRLQKKNIHTRCHPHQKSADINSNNILPIYNILWHNVLIRCILLILAKKIYIKFSKTKISTELLTSVKDTWLNELTLFICLRIERRCHFNWHTHKHHLFILFNCNSSTRWVRFCWWTICFVVSFYFLFILQLTCECIYLCRPYLTIIAN